MEIRWSLFPKFYQHLDPPGLAALVRETGLDTVNMVVRDGYPVTPEALAVEAPAFVRAMAAEGLKIHYATTAFEPAQLERDDTPLDILRDCGLTQFRMGYFTVPGNGDVRGARRQARRDLEVMAGLCEKHGLQAVYQLHHTLLFSSAASIWPLVEDLPPERLGVMLDPGNQSFEGQEDWLKSACLLGTHLTALGVKDTAIARQLSHANRPGKGWQRWWAPIYEGVTNWHEVIGALNTVDFKGTFVFMPFYDMDDPATMTAKLKKEVAWLRGVAAEVQAHSTS